MVAPVLSDAQQRQLVEAARGDDERLRERALAELLADFRGPALASIHRTLGAAGLGHEHAEEALAAATLKYLEVGLSRYRGDSAPRTYFVRIAINAALDVARALRRSQERAEERELPVAAPGDESASTRLELEARRRALQECLAELSDKLRQAMLLYYVEEGGDCETCARQLETSKAAFEQRLSRGRLALAECLRRKLRLDE